ENLGHFKKQPWFIDWMQGRFTDDMTIYFGESTDFKNRVAANYILASNNHSRFIKEYHRNVKVVLEQLEERLE
ncbi:MAG: hypothetical protein AAF901_11435, partial [Bacteroidota bacterium]